MHRPSSIAGETVPLKRSYQVYFTYAAKGESNAITHPSFNLNVMIYANQWAHLVLLKEDDTLKIFVNGKQTLVEK